MGPSRLAPLAGSAQPIPVNLSSKTASTAVQNEKLTPSVREALTNAYSNAMDVPRAEITGMRPGSAFYAFDPTTGRRWAVADFQFSTVVVAEQDGGSQGVFSQPRNGHWQFVGHGEIVGYPNKAVVDCRRKLPNRVMLAWSWNIRSATCGS